MKFRAVFLAALLLLNACAPAMPEGRNARGPYCVNCPAELDMDQVDPPAPLPWYLAALAAIAVSLAALFAGQQLQGGAK